MKGYPYEFDGGPEPIDAVLLDEGVYEFRPPVRTVGGERYRLVKEGDVMVLYTGNGMLVATSEPLKPKQ